MGQFRDVLSYTYQERIRGKGFIISTIVMILVLIFIVSLPKIYTHFSSGTKGTIAVIDESGLFVTNGDELKKSVSADYEWTLKKASDEKDLLQQIKDGDLEGLVKIDNTSEGPKVVATVNTLQESAVMRPLQNYFQGIVTSKTIASLQLNQQQVSALSAELPFDVKELTTGLSKSFLPVYLMMMLLFFTIGVYGSTVATAVASEKSSRIMEVLITTVRPLWLMFGKVFGVALVTITQYAILAVVAIATYKLTYDGPVNISGLTVDFSSITGATLAYLIVFFLLGYFLYATIFAAMGSLVSRSEDVSQVMIFPMLIILISYFCGIFTMNSPDSLFSTIMSFVPISAPIVMFTRIGMVDVPFIQILISMVLLLISVVIGCWFSAKIYRVGVLMYGKRPSLGEVFKAIKSYRI